MTEDATTAARVEPDSYPHFHESLTELIDRLRLQCGLVDEDYAFGDAAKVDGLLECDSRVRIHWDSSPTVHNASVFALPGLEEADVWMGGVIFVRYPAFADDMDCPGPIWMTVDQALHNQQISRIEVCG